MKPTLVKNIDIKARKLEKGSLVKIILDQEVGANNLAMGIVSFEPSAKTSDHSRDVEEVIFVLKGEATIVTNHETFTLNERDTVLIPPGITHRHENRGKKLLKQIYIFAPQGPEKTLRNLEIM